MRPRLLMEAPAGLAALSLYVHGGPRCRPPISRIGVKTGYCEPIANIVGLEPGRGADAYLWAEAELDVVSLLRCYPDAAMLRRVAEVIRGWKDEDARELWHRLRDERAARKEQEVSGPEAAAAWMFLHHGSFSGKGPAFGIGRPEGAEQAGNMIGLRPSLEIVDDAVARLAGYVFLAQTHHEAGTLRGGFVHPEEGGRYGAGREETAERCQRLAEFAYVTANAHGGTGGWKVVPASRPNTTANLSPEGLAARFEALAQDVASFGLLAQWSFRRGEPDSGFNAGLLTDREPTPTGGNGAKARTVEQEAGLWTPAAEVASAWPPVLVTTQIPEPGVVAELLGTPGDLEGVVVYMDPPYKAKNANGKEPTGYLHDISRAEVVRLARGFAALGAVVPISEGEPIPELVAEGWHAPEITEGRKGQKRTFSAQQREFVTINREPRHRVAVQAALF